MFAGASGKGSISEGKQASPVPEPAPTSCEQPGITVAAADNEVEIGQIKHSSEEDVVKDWSQFELKGKGLSSFAKLTSDGRIKVSMNLLKHLPELPEDYNNEVLEVGIERPEDKEPPETIPKLSILILVVGSRGDVQPYLALAMGLQENSHRVRLGTHAEFKAFITDHGVEFFDIGGDPRELMAYMVKNPGLFPGKDSLLNGDVQKKRRMIATILDGCYKATYMPDAESGAKWATDVIISNPPTFAHIHVAEALGLPLMMSFTMPWLPTKSFSHPLVSISTSNVPQGLANVLSFAIAERLTWQGLSSVINVFRTKTLGLAPLSLGSGPSVLERLKVPWTFAWSETLIPKPKDWKNHVDVSGFFFLNSISSYSPPKDLMAFLVNGEKPIYIGFGSIPVEDPSAMSKVIFDAVKISGHRAIVSAGWGDLGGGSVPEQVFIQKSNIPHDWLFSRVSAVVHHGGAGTTAIGLLNGLPTVVCYFFGDQIFWGDMVYKAGAGPKPLPGKSLTTEDLVDAIKFALQPRTIEAAKRMGEQIRAENGVKSGVDSFHKHLPLKSMRCEVCPTRVAVWWSDDLCLRLSAFAAQLLVEEKKIMLSSLEPHRAKEYDTRKQATDPITGGSAAILMTIASHYASIAQIFYDPPRGIINVHTAIPKGILNIIEGVYEGFYNAPKLYGSQVRQVGKVKSFRDGVEEGAKGVVLGWWDGITGLVSEPLAGGKKEGLVGAIKGSGRSFVNATVKPAAGILGAIHHPISGAWKSIRSTWATQLDSMVIETRKEEGIQQYQQSDDGEKQEAFKMFLMLERFSEERRKQLREDAKQIIKDKTTHTDSQKTKKLTLVDYTENPRDEEEFISGSSSEPVPSLRPSSPRDSEEF